MGKSINRFWILDFGFGGCRLHQAGSGIGKSLEVGGLKPIFLGLLNVLEQASDLEAANRGFL